MGYRTRNLVSLHISELDVYNFTLIVNLSNQNEANSLHPNSELNTIQYTFSSSIILRMGQIKRGDCPTIFFYFFLFFSSQKGKIMVIIVAHFRVFTVTSLFYLFLVKILITRGNGSSHFFLLLFIFTEKILSVERKYYIIINTINFNKAY